MVLRPAARSTRKRAARPRMRHHLFVHAVNECLSSLLLRLFFFLPHCASSSTPSRQSVDCPSTLALARTDACQWQLVPPQASIKRVDATLNHHPPATGGHTHAMLGQQLSQGGRRLLHRPRPLPPLRASPTRTTNGPAAAAAKKPDNLLQQQPAHSCWGAAPGRRRLSTSTTAAAGAAGGGQTEHEGGGPMAQYDRLVQSKKIERCVRCVPRASCLCGVTGRRPQIPRATQPSTPTRPLK